MKTAVVTGSSYGIGYSVTSKLLDEGYKVYGISRSETKIDNDNFVWLKCDLYNQDEIKESTKLIKEEKIELLINNAGTHFEERGSDFSTDSFKKMFDLNFVSPILLSKYLVNKLEAGSIINISSTSDRFAEAGSGLYCASKSALNMFFEAFSMENSRIKVIHLLPNYVDTPLQRSMKHDVNFDWGQCVSSDDVADTIIKIMKDEIDLETNTKVIVLNNESLDAIEDPEKLYCFNVDTKEVKKLK